MKFINKDEHSEIHFTIGERWRLFFKGCLKLDHLNAYRFYSGFLSIVSHAMDKYGDGRKHGQQEVGTEIKVKND
jgi:hypothetical protein